MATAYISRTFGAPTDEDKWTLSFWYKKCDATAGVRVLDADGGGNEGNISFDATTGKLNFYQYQSSLDTQLITSNVYRDPGAFYHIVVIFDAANGTSSDRAQIWVNGERVTTLGTATYPTTLYSQINKSGVVHYIGAKGSASSKYCDGVFSHMNFVDGSALAPSYFGETDSTSEIWKINPSPSVTYGNNGFFLKFEDRTNLDLDSSPNAHTFTTTGTITPTYDNPSNNFCTLSDIMSPIKAATYSNGYTTVEASSVDMAACGNLGMSKGAWYWETKITRANNINLGLVPAALINSQPSGMGWDQGSGNNALNVDNSIGIRYGGNMYEKAGGSQVSTTTTSFDTGDIIGIAFNASTGAFRFFKDGVEMTGSPYTLGDGNYATNWGAAGPLLPGYRLDAGGGTTKVECNFGNGYFGTTAVASTNADAAGIGSFEYAVPASHYALCTKNIKAYGG